MPSTLLLEMAPPGADDREVVRALAMIILCVAAGIGFGTFFTAQRAARQHVDRDEMLRRGASATSAAAAVQGAVRIDDRSARVSRVRCSSAPTDRWTCAASFRSTTGGDEITGPDAPVVDLMFSGRDHISLRACTLRLPQQGLTSDCTKSARAALERR